MVTSFLVAKRHQAFIALEYPLVGSRGRWYGGKRGTHPLLKILKHECWKEIRKLNSRGVNREIKDEQN